MNELIKDPVVKKIAFIGLGAMGAPMAANLLRAGHWVCVHNRTRSKEEPLAELGADRAISPAAAADNADIVITNVSDAPNAKEVICGPSGVMEGISTGKLLVDMGTIGPKAAREIAVACSQTGVRFLDAPVSGGVWGAENGTLSIMVGGTVADFDEALPVFQAMGNSIIHFGPVGSGQAAKLVNQVIGAGTLAAVAEGVVLAEKLGLDQRKTIEAISTGASASWTLENLGPRMLGEDYNTGFKVNLMIKDLRLALEAADEVGFPITMARLSQQFLQAARAAGHGEHGTQSIVQAFERLGSSPGKRPSTSG